MCDLAVRGRFPQKNSHTPRDRQSSDHVCNSCPAPQDQPECRHHVALYKTMSRFRPRLAACCQQMARRERSTDLFFAAAHSPPSLLPRILHEWKCLWRLIRRHAARRLRSLAMAELSATRPGSGCVKELYSISSFSRSHASHAGMPRLL